MAELRAMPDASVDTVVTDPPYFLPARHYATRKKFPRSLADLSMLEHFYRDWFVETSRVLKPSGCWYVFCDGQSYPAFFAVAYPHAKRAVPLVWDKQVSINGYSWRPSHELILYVERDETPLVPTGDGDILRGRSVKIDDRDHPAEKPVEILRRLIEKSTPIGGLVLDTFAGSGATGRAALECGRSALLVERDAAYYAASVAALRADFGERIITRPSTVPIMPDNPVYLDDCEL